ncbi:MAG TPA: hypothetical protein DCP63_03110 [Bacteroidetes bacterium]|nr:hypothetical protein [Bacteroidota bacterium]
MVAGQLLCTNGSVGAKMFIIGLFKKLRAPEERDVYSTSQQAIFLRSSCFVYLWVAVSAIQLLLIFHPAPDGA